MPGIVNIKERFRRIAPPLVEEVRQHIQEMLDGGAIPSGCSGAPNQDLSATDECSTIRAMAARLRKFQTWKQLLIRLGLVRTTTTTNSICNDKVDFHLH